MSIQFYDEWDATPDQDGWVDIDRIYCFDWNAFDAGLFERLRRVFRSLPRSEGDDAHGCHWWYSNREDLANGYLTAGVEPPGLQVFGTLPVGTWHDWDAAFQIAAADLPCRAVK
jgi:hypothetical protein